MTPAPRRHALLLALGLLVAVSSIPHALLGAPAVAEALRAAGVDAENTGGILAGWYYGSAAMLTLGTIVVLAWRDARAGGDFGWRAALAVGAAYLAFGLVAGTWRRSAHLLGFAVIGAAICFAALRARPTRG